MNLLQHQMSNHHQKASHIQEILRNATTHPNRYHMYRLTLIQTLVYQILLCCNHFTHLNPVILNKDNVLINKIGKSRNNDSIKHFPMRISKLLKAAYNSKVTLFKLYEDSIQRWVYLQYLINPI